MESDNTIGKINALVAAMEAAHPSLSARLTYVKLTWESIDAEIVPNVELKFSEPKEENAS